jgi:conjugative transfer signal peptidase TraF
MKRYFKRFAIGLAVALGLLILQGLYLHMIGVRVNVSPSIPLGVYWAKDLPVERGAYVMFCPPQIEVFRHAMIRGYIGGGQCPGGYGYVMKRVAAASGDVVDVAMDGVRINGSLYPRSALMAVDALGRSMPRYQSDHYTLSEFQLLLMADDHPKSFDARYFGPVQRKQIKDVIVPILTWKSKDKEAVR